MMQSHGRKNESELCVDKLLVEIGKMDHLVEKLDSDRDSQLICQARNLSSTVQSFIDNYKEIIPSYCLKKATDSLKRLENHINNPQMDKLKFKFKSAPKTRVQLQADKTIELSSSIPQDYQTVSLGFKGRENEKLNLNPSDVETKDISLVDLKNCDVNIEGLANTVYMRNLSDTSVTVCLACRAITVVNCDNCQFKLVCQQLRIDETSRSIFTIYTSARSMLESSRELEFRNLNLDTLGGNSHEQVRNLFKEANFDPQQNNWKCIDDFDWLSPKNTSKNFSIVES